MVLAAQALAELPAEGQSLNFPRTDRYFQTQVMRVRGYYPVDTCLFRQLPCFSVNGNFRPEATAQATAMRFLNFKRGTTIFQDRVQWEVGPSPDATYAPQHAAPNPPEPDDDDIPDPDLNPACLTSPPNSCRWRIDIVVDDSPSPATQSRFQAPKPGMFEVRRWGPGVQAAVNTRLVRYRSQTSGIFLDFVRSRELKFWSQAYTGPGGPQDVWCVWGDDELMPQADGNVYFAPAPEVPPAVALRTPGCALVTSRIFIERKRRQLRTTAAFVDFDLAVQQSVSPVTVVMAWGDGTPDETVAVPAGTGVSRIVMSHTFPAGRTAPATQRATIVQTGEFDESVISMPNVVAATAGTPQSVATGSQIATPMSTTVTDAGGQPVLGVPVTFTAPFSSASGTFPDGGRVAVVETGPGGVATAPAFRASASAGSYSVVATADGVAQGASFLITNVGNQQPC